jgi:hypothetical protein
METTVFEKVPVCFLFYLFFFFRGGGKPYAVRLPEDELTQKADELTQKADELTQKFDSV